MMPSRTKPDARMMQIALLAGLASVLQLAESCIPMPLPGMKIGLANLVTLIAIVTLGPGSGIQVALLRTLVSSLMMGTFLSTTFLLSLAGALTSALMMGAMYVINRRLKLFSLIGISVVGAVANNAAQLAVVYGLFARVAALQWFIPYLLATAILTGYLTGFIAARVCRRLSRSRAAGLRAGAGALFPLTAAAGDSSVRSSITFAVIAAGFIAGVFVGDIRVLAGIIAAALTAAVWTDAGNGRGLIAGFRRMLPYLLVIFLINVIGRPAGGGGMAAGATAGARLTVFFLLGFLTTRSIPRADLARLMMRLLRPLDGIGIKSANLVRQVTYACEAVPLFSKAVSDRFRMLKAARGKRKNFTYVAAYVTTALVTLLGGLGA